MLFECFLFNVVFVLKCEARAHICATVRLEPLCFRSMQGDFSTRGYWCKGQFDTMGEFGKGAFGKGDFGQGDFGKGDVGKDDFGKCEYGKSDFGKGQFGKKFGPYKGNGKGNGKGKGQPTWLQWCM